eukprot:scaffold336989_cov19-Prasinocladus_malaysianus.AAC.1
MFQALTRLAFPLRHRSSLCTSIWIAPWRMRETLAYATPSACEWRPRSHPQTHHSERRGGARFAGAG